MSSLSSQHLPAPIGNFRQHSQRLLGLALPLLGAQLAQTGMGVVDTIMAGRLSATDLAAVSVGTSIFAPLMLLITGTLLATTPSVAQHVGGKRYQALANVVQQASWLGLLMVILGALLMANAMPVFQMMGVSGLVSERAQGYLWALIPGLPALAFFQILRCLCEGLNHTRPVLLISLFGLLVNIPANYVLIYGELGFPQLGAQGCGFATSLSFWSMALLAAIYVHRAKSFNAFGIFHRWQPPHWRDIGELAWIGLPIGAAIFVEASLFTTIALFVGGLGDRVVAGHQIALNFTTILFMLPLSLSMALTVLVGQPLGAKRPQEAQAVAWHGVQLSLLVALISALIIGIGAPYVVRLYTLNTEVQTLASSLLYLAVIYQLSDALQVSAAGALRGYKDTRVVMLLTVPCYWLIGLGIGHILATGGIGIAPQGVHGYWYGLIAGLTCAAIALLFRLRWTAQKTSQEKALQEDTDI